jgi:glycosyltransferase involved in cell wall biosynthesis
MPAFNVAPYIEEAIESVLAQRCTVPYRLYIAEDCSTDSTREICERYAQKHPDKIVLICNAQNLGLPQSFSRVHNQITEDYFCVLDGDDYFTDVKKLSIQFELLEHCPDVAVCAHNTERVGDRGSLPATVVSSLIPERTFGGREVARASVYFATSSIMYRNVFRNRVPAYFYEERGSDEILRTLVHSQFGQIAYLPALMSAWRFRPGSRWNGLSWRIQQLKLLNDYANWNEISGYQYDQELTARSLELVRINLSTWKGIASVPRHPVFYAKLGYRGVRNVAGHWWRRSRLRFVPLRGKSERDSAAA